MNFKRALLIMEKGGSVRRAAWHPSSEIGKTHTESPFVALKTLLGVKAWQPYYADFHADDWEVVFDDKETV